jgi:pyruvate-ferredoxin/flavodoxin oxidoreductase
MPPGTTSIEQRTIAANVPTWKADACSQCNMCAFICPHAAIRPALMTEQEMGQAPGGFETRPVRGSKALSEYRYRMQVGCGCCSRCWIITLLEQLTDWLAAR